jgi:uncharacterized protein
MRSALLALALLVAVATAAAAPAPLPTPLGLVSDFARVIDARTMGLLNARLNELRDKTGAEIAVVTVATTEPDDVFDYAMRLAETWKPGTKGRDNGVVFLTAVQDRALHILTGYGIEGALPDGLVGEIRDRSILPRYRSGDYAGGILAGVDSLAAVIAREYDVELTGAPRAPAPTRRHAARPEIGGLTLLILLILFFVVLPRVMGAMPQQRRRWRRNVWMGGPMWGGFGGGGFGGRGGGFGGFGGGGFGGGGAGGRW